MRKHEKANLMLQTTECVQASFAQNDLTDGILRLEVGRADELARFLYPQVVLPPPEEHADALTKDNARFTLRGASTSAIRCVFPSRLCEVIDSSELRAWERENHLLNATDCVTLEVSRGKRYCGAISVRIGYIMGFQILRELCGQA